MVRGGMVCVWGGDCKHTNQRPSHAASLAVSGSPIKTCPFGDVPLEVVWFFAPLL